MREIKLFPTTDTDTAGVPLTSQISSDFQLKVNFYFRLSDLKVDKIIVLQNRILCKKYIL